MIVPPKYADVLKKYMPQADVRMFKGAGHDLTATHSEGVASLIIEFLKV